jgi:hypothetical protein
MVDESLTAALTAEGSGMDFEQSVIVPTKLVLGGIVVGVVPGFAIAQLDPGPTMAAVSSRQPFTVGKALDTHLARFDGDYYAIGTEPSVSMVPESSVEIRKIGYGRTQFVNVVTTSSGTYSTDGLRSPNIKYPGIHVEPLEPFIVPFGGVVLGWSSLTGWVRIPLLSANSIRFLDNYTVPASRDGVCVSDTRVGGCR